MASAYTAHEDVFVPEASEMVAQLASWLRAKRLR